MKTSAALLVCLIMFMFAFSDEQSLLIKVHDVGVNSLKLSWEYGENWFWARVKCLGEHTPHTPNNCTTDILRKSSYKPTTVYGLAPTYSYRFEIELMQLDPNEIIISNTTDLIVMGISPIKINEIELLETEKVILVHYAFDPAGLWYGNVEMIVVSHPPTTITSKNMSTDEMCNNPKCDGAFIFLIQRELLPGYTYVITAYASKFVINAQRLSDHLVRNCTIPPRNIRRLEAKATKTPRQIELRWLWPTQGIWTDYAIGCEVSTLHNGVCSYKRFSFIQANHGSKRGNDLKYLVDDLFGGAKYKFFVELESCGVPSSRKAYADIIVAPGSVTDLKYERVDRAVRLKWKWPIKSSWTHYSVKCSTSSTEEVSCVKTLYPVNQSDIKETAEHEHIYNNSKISSVYTFEVSVEWFGVPALHPMKVEVGAESRSPGHRKSLNIVAILSITLIALSSIALMAILVVYAIKRKKIKISQLSEARLKVKRKGRNLLDSSKSLNSFISVSGPEPGTSTLNDHHDFLKSEVFKEVQKSDIGKQDSIMLKKKLKKAHKVVSREHIPLPKPVPSFKSVSERKETLGIQTKQNYESGQKVEATNLPHHGQNPTLDLKASKNYRIETNNGPGPKKDGSNASYSTYYPICYQLKGSKGTPEYMSKKQLGSIKKTEISKVYSTLSSTANDSQYIFSIPEPDLKLLEKLNQEYRDDYYHLCNKEDDSTYYSHLKLSNETKQNSQRNHSGLVKKKRRTKIIP